MSHRQIISESTNGEPVACGAANTSVHICDVDGRVDLVRLVLSNMTAGALTAQVIIAGGTALKFALAANDSVELPELPVTGKNNAIQVNGGGAQAGDVQATGTFVRE